MRLWLTESGPTGAEQYEDDIFIYDVARDRQPIEWLREVTHEWGHFALPRMGRFTEPEPYANGVLGEALLLQMVADEAGLVTGAAWPAERAQAAVNGLWGGGPVALADFLTQTRRDTLDLWLARGPNSELAAGLGEESFRYLVGALLWIEAAHGHELLRSTLLKAPGESPADFYGYRQAIRGRRLKGGDGARGRFGPWGAAADHAAGGAAAREVRLAAATSAFGPICSTVRRRCGSRRACAVRLNVYLDGIGPLPLEGGEALVWANAKRAVR